MIFKRFLATIVCLLIFLCGQAQDFSNKGTEFWVGYGYHQSMTVDNNQNMVLYFTSDVAATVKVEIPALGWVKSYGLAPNSVTESDAMPKSGSQDARLLSEGLFNTGIHITSDNPIVAYAHIYNSTNSGASLLFPVITLGQDYYSLNFTQHANTVNSNSWTYVIATEDNTTVEITPTGNTLNHAAGQAFSVSLNKGEIYNLMGKTTQNNGEDLTGTRIRSISSGSSGCKKIAVFSGSGRLSVNCDNTYASTSDNVIQQVFPRNAWGKKFLTVPTEKLPNNYFRIAVSDPSTVVKIDGAPATNLVNNFYYEILANTPKSIVADKPIMVSQFITSAGTTGSPTCGNSFTVDGDPNGDPEMIYLSPVEQTIDNITLNSTSHYKITTHFINVIIKSSAVNSFTLDNASKASSFVKHPQDPAYSYAVFSVPKGSHNLKADSGFNAIAYGYGVFESYGYNAGTNIKDLYQFITLRNRYATVNFPATCKDTRFFFSVTLPFKVSQLTWDFGGNSHLTPGQNVTLNNPAPDSSYITDGKTLYVYSLPSLYAFDATGTYPIKITANNQTSDGCNGVEETTYDIKVLNAPVVDFTFTTSGCTNDSVYFKDASNGSGRVLQQWRWQFGDAGVDSVANPHKAFIKAGTYDIRETAINEIGCATEATKPLTIAPKPVANFNLAKQNCQGVPITFTDQSTIASGKITKWNWNFGDGTGQNLSDASPFTKTFNAAGNYTVSLVVQTDNGCKSDTTKQSTTINSLPVSNFISPKVCVNDPFAAFADSSYMPGTAGASFTYQWNFGDGNATAANPNASTAQNPRHKYAAAGSYKASLTVTANTGCSATTTKSFTVNGGSPKADFSYIDNGVICSNAKIGIQNNSSIDIGSITKVQIIWDSQNVPSTVQTDDTPYVGKSYYHIFPVVQTTKTYQVKMIAFSGTNCFSEKVMPVTVNPSPAVTFTAIAGICLNANARNIIEAKETTGISGSFTFSGNGITSSGVFNPAVAGPGTTTLHSVFTSAAGCKDSASQTINVISNPVVSPSAPVYVLEGGSAVLNPSVTGNVTQYLWSPATYLNNSTIKNPVSLPKDSITYNLTVTTQGGCQGYGKLTVLILKDLAIPNAFSPNGDGINDVWNIASLASYPDCSVEIYNRYGTIVYRSVGYSKPWQGTFNGSSLPTGVYYYIIDPKNGKKRYAGYVTILK